jgi:hypothetical protein
MEDLEEVIELAPMTYTSEEVITEPESVENESPIDPSILSPQSVKGDRREDWPEKLFESIEQATSQIFAFGTHDCTLFSANCVKAMTGYDGATWRGKYSTKGEAIRIIALAGGMENLATAVFGSEEIPTIQAQRGDGVLADAIGGEAIGICVGNDCAFLTVEKGIIYLPLSEVKRAWRV